MNKKDILAQTQAYIKKTFLDEGTGHDYFHIERVVTNAKKILETEDADPFLVELAAWTHDIGDYKLHDGVDKSEKLIRAFLASIQVEEETIVRILEIVSQVSFSKGNKPTTIEAEIVQDADRLDAIGAVGIARCFAYGGSVGSILYNPYDNSKDASSVQHFYDKLFRLKDLMNTKTAKQIAEKRHLYMENFIQEFYQEVK
ncbi:HD domain-containing protein [Empedobacter stercoris]|uniref:HD domain-containing protein n=2 Tax=Empedobacter TaxID=59734 RepID=A0ABY8V4N2_9FLAO|nr:MULTISPECIES: HD domain-containing protein [Empedobacter]MCA4777670.1 HD domain-containing protein [Empedobacter stercoris]MCA4809861.1 HD domain-containing protein [Empedobacter stercoris]NOJ76510.1 HD domain-containing protein [Empedobacter stercoris]QNT15031.1 HD domain-containing protein [Empedobacter stercoris]UWX66435.1 HD domain-containing protein [Empedobacter stercoris]